MDKPEEAAEDEEDLNDEYALIRASKQHIQVEDVERY